MACVLVTAVRIEGIWVPFAVAFVLFLRGSRDRKAAVFLMTVSLSVFFLIGLARLHYTGAFWPNPVYAKWGGVGELLPLGLIYLKSFLVSSPLLLAINVAAWVAIVVFYDRWFKLNQSHPQDLLILVVYLFVVLQDIFVLVTGGNWMSHFRFLVVTLPLKAILFSYMGERFLEGTRVRIPVIFIVFSGLALLPSQSGQHPVFHAFSQPKPIQLADIPIFSLHDLQSQMIFASAPHSRDERDLRPFIENELPKFVGKGKKPLCIATYQGGYFPYLLRQYFSSKEVYIVDCLGLINRSMALRQGFHTPIGLGDGTHIDKLIMRHDPDLFALCGGERPDLVYSLYVTPIQLQNFFRAGYQLIWSRPEAVVLKRDDLTTQ
jgi:hypothetical protein